MSDPCDPMDCSLQAPLPMGFSRQEYWSGLPFSSPGYLPNTGIEPRSPVLQADSFLTELLGKPKVLIKYTGAGALRLSWEPEFPQGEHGHQRQQPL